MPTLRACLRGPRIASTRPSWSSGSSASSSGTATHIFDLLTGGTDTYTEFPTAVRLSWVCLTILDPVTLVLLALRRPAGIVLALVVIFADVAVNWTVFVIFGDFPLFAVVNQTLFAVLLFNTAPMLWRGFGTRSEATAGLQETGSA